MAAPKEIVDLVEEFERDQSFYKSSQFNETELRTRFINPLIAALGWDVYHEQPCVLPEETYLNKANLDN